MGYPVDPNVYYNIEGFGTMQSFRSFPHTGDDWTTYKGQSLPIVKAVYGGVILEAWFESGAGNQVVLAADDGGFWVYGHLSAFAVKRGDRVKEGQAIGRMGNTGFTTGAHLHLMRYTVEWAARQRYIARTFSKGAKLSQATIAAFARDSYLTDPTKHYGSKTTPTNPPAKTQEEKDLEEIMGAVSDIKQYTREQVLSANKETRRQNDARADAIEKYVNKRITAMEDRMRREVRMRIIYVAGPKKQFDENTSPYAAVINVSGGGFIPLLEPSKRASQIKSLKANYLLIADAEQPAGMSENAFFNQLREIARGIEFVNAAREKRAGVDVTTADIKKSAGWV